MRRVFLAFLSSLLLLVSGCSAGAKSLAPGDVNLSFACRARVTCGGGEYVCSFRRTGAAGAALEILSGSGAGLEYLWTGDGFSAGYRGLSAQSETCVLPDGAFPRLLKEALDCAAQPGALTQEGDNSFSGAVGGCLFHLEADGGTGFPSALTVPDWGMKAVFSGCAEPDAAEAAASR